MSEYGTRPFYNGGLIQVETNVRHPIMSEYGTKPFYGGGFAQVKTHVEVFRKFHQCYHSSFFN